MKSMRSIVAKDDIKIMKEKMNELKTATQNYIHSSCLFSPWMKVGRCDELSLELEQRVRELKEKMKEPYQKIVKIKRKKGKYFETLTEANFENIPFEEICEMNSNYQEARKDAFFTCLLSTSPAGVLEDTYLDFCNSRQKLKEIKQKHDSYFKDMGLNKKETKILKNYARIVCEN